MTPENIEPLKSRHGYLLIKLQLSGAAPSIEYSKIRSLNQSFLTKNQQVKTYGNKFILELKNKSYGYYLQVLPAGLYQITRLNVPYFDFPFRLNTNHQRDWRFNIEAGKINYAGKLVIEKERTTKQISVRLLNRIATDKAEIELTLKDLIENTPLISGSGVRDDFYEILTNN